MSPPAASVCSTTNNRLRKLSEFHSSSKERRAPSNFDEDDCQRQQGQYDKTQVVQRSCRPVTGGGLIDRLLALVEEPFGRRFERQGHEVFVEESDFSEKPDLEAGTWMSHREHPQNSRVHIIGADEGGGGRRQRGIFRRVVVCQVEDAFGDGQGRDAGYGGRVGRCSFKGVEREPHWM